MKTVLLLLLLSISGSFCLAQNKLWTLKECIDQASLKNVLLNQNRVTNELNKINVVQSVYSRLPTLSGTGSQGFQLGRSIDPSTNVFKSANYSTNNFSIASNVTLFNGFQQINNIKQDRVLYESGKLDVEKINNDLILSVAAAYLQILFSYELLENNRALVESDRVQVERTQKQVDAGTLPELSLLQIQSQMANDQLSLADAENQLSIAKITLMQYMEHPLSDFDVERPVLPEPDSQRVMVTTSAEVYTTSLTTQPQIKSYALKTRSSMIGVRIAQGAYTPRLTLTGNIFTIYSSTSPISFETQLKQKIGEQFSMSLNVPIFNGLLSRTNVQRAKVNVRIAQYNEQNTKNQLRKSIEQAVVDLRAAQNRYFASKLALASADLSYQNSMKRFSVGLMSSTDFLIQKNSLFAAKTDLAQAKYDYFFKHKVLEFYQGRPITF
jgi:outer membrane protein